MRTSTLAVLVLSLGGAYWLVKHKQAQGEIMELPPIVPPMVSLPGSQDQVVSAPLPPPIAATMPAPDPTQLTALLGWTGSTGNQPLYAAWVSQLSPADVNNMYDILVNDWMTGSGATPTQTSNWNDLVSRYPFLRVPQSMVGGCTNFNCN